MALIAAERRGFMIFTVWAMEVWTWLGVAFTILGAMVDSEGTAEGELFLLVIGVGVVDGSIDELGL